MNDKWLFIFALGLWSILVLASCRFIFSEEQKGNGLSKEVLQYLKYQDYRGLRDLMPSYEEARDLVIDLELEPTAADAILQSIQENKMYASTFFSKTINKLHQEHGKAINDLTFERFELIEDEKNTLSQKMVIYTQNKSCEIELMILPLKYRFALVDMTFGGCQ